MYSRNGLGKLFLYSEAPLKIPHPRISFRTNPSAEAPQGTKRSTYKAIAVLLILVTAAGSTYLFLPRPAGAFWPFSVAKADESAQPMLHDTKLALLEAAVNPDPNPSKGVSDLTVSGDSALVPNAGPEGTIPDASNPPVSGGSISVYVVQEGDSLSGIASKFGVTTNTILWANDIKDPKTIHTGTSLIILPVSGIKHTVTKGETVSSIAAKFNADAGDIAAFNNIGTDAALTVGDELIIPGGELASTAVPTSKSSNTGSTKTKSSSTGSTKIKTGGSLADVKKNPYRGGSGTEIDGYYGNPVPGAIVTQGIHGWNGVDLAAPSGTPIYAAAAGTVIVSKVGGWNGGYGNYVVIDHGNGTQTLYSHMSTDSVSVGDSVSKGQRVGSVGKTGEATGFHLHFEVRGARNPFADCSLMSTCSPE